VGEAVAEIAGPPLCLRCKTVRLDVLHSDAEIAFLACPSCQREYTRRAGGALVERWRGPLSIALYGVIFAEDAIPHAERLAEQLAQLASSWDPATLELFISEIELELADPIQAVTEILPMAAPKTEENLREFLRLVAVRLRERLVN